MTKTAENLRAMARHGDEDGVKELLSALRKRAEGSDGSRRTKLERVVAGCDTISGNTALHYCCANGHSNIALMLVEAGAPVDALNNSGSTPLHYAALTGQLEVVRGLTNSGADLMKRNNFGNTPHDEAVQCSHRDVADFLMSVVESRAAQNPPVFNEEDDKTGDPEKS